MVNCARSPPCVEETWLTLERCRQLRLDSSWPTFDPYIRRDARWTSARQLLHDQARSKTVLLFGDSVARQSLAGLRCEAARDQLTLTFDSPRVAAWQAAVSAVNRSVWVQDEPSDVIYIAETDTVLARHWGGLDEADIAAALSVTDLALLNFGLHYHDEAVYAARLELLFAQLAAFNALPGKLAVFRETSMQAFYQSGAYVAGAETTTSYCAPVPPEAVQDNAVWRQNAIARAAAARHGVPLMPFYDATRVRWDMFHEKLCRVPDMVGVEDATERCAATNCTDACATDCTHLCATPTLWAWFVHELSVALAHKFPLRHQLADDDH